MTVESRMISNSNARMSTQVTVITSDMGISELRMHMHVSKMADVAEEGRKSEQKERP